MGRETQDIEEGVCRDAHTILNLFLILAEAGIQNTRQSPGFPFSREWPSGREQESCYFLRPPRLKPGSANAKIKSPHMVKTEPVTEGKKWRVHGMKKLVASWRGEGDGKEIVL